MYPWVKEEVPPTPTPYTNYGRSPGPRGQQYDIRRHCQREAGLLNFRQQLRGCYNMYEETVSIEPCLSNSLCVLIRCMATAELHQRTGPTCTFHLNNPTLGELGLVRLGVTLGAVHLAIVTAFVKANCTKLSSIGARNLCHRLLSHDIVSGWSVWLASGLRLACVWWFALVLGALLRDRTAGL